MADKTFFYESRTGDEITLSFRLVPLGPNKDGLDEYGIVRTKCFSHRYRVGFGKYEGLTGSDRIRMPLAEARSMLAQLQEEQHRAVPPPESGMIRVFYSAPSPA